MINRPRCRDWSPLATQQLRLRNLIQITGHNIQAEPNTLIYFTLHLTLMSAPFFTSEPLESFRNAIWAEINCQHIHKSTSQFVVIRVWQTSNRSRSRCRTAAATETNSSVLDAKHPCRLLSNNANNVTTVLEEQSRRNSIEPQIPATTDTDANVNNVTNNNNNNNNISNSSSNDKDKVLFVWGVYFSGLVPITKRSEVKLTDNALILYIHGGFFTSAEYLLAESLSKQYKHFFATSTTTTTTTTTKKRNLANNLSIAATKGGTTTHNIINVTVVGKNCDSLKSSSRNIQVNENVEISSGGGDDGDRKLPIHHLASTPPLKQHRYDTDSRYSNSGGRLSPSHDVIANLQSPSTNKQHQHHHNHNYLQSSQSDLTAAAAATHSDQQSNGDEEYAYSDPNVLKIRFLDKEFFKWEIRQSYNVQKLLLLQEKQRIFRKKTQSANEVMEKICMKSASCLNLQLIANKGMLYRPRGNPSIGRTLNRLLTAQQEQPKPEDLLRAQELRRKIESAKFRCRFLTMERDRYKVILRKLHDKCTKQNDENIEKESWLMDDYRELSRSRDLTIEQKSLYSSKQKTFERIKESLIQRQYQLLGQLRDVYVIKERDQRNGIYEINGICLPNTDTIRMYYSSNPPGTNNAALSLSVAMCYVAHAVLLCSSVLNVPLRNKIIYQGSASKIRDDIKVLTEHDREFPLYCRHIPPSDSLLYAAFLLNQNISQIKFMLNLHSSREDIRATLPNLLAILSVGDNQMAEKYYGIQESASASSFLAIDSHDVPMSSISETSIDLMMISVPTASSSSVTANASSKLLYASTSDENINLPIHSGRQNIGSCRTRGSYSDDHLVVKHHKKKTTRSVRLAPTSSIAVTNAAASIINPHKIFGSEPLLTMITDRGDGGHDSDAG